MKKNILLFQIMALLLLGACDKDEVNSVDLLTDNSSKTWVLDEHNFLTGDLGFIKTPPGVFLDIYLADKIIFHENGLFNLGRKDFYVDPTTSTGGGYWQFDKKQNILCLTNTSMGIPNQDVNGDSPCREFLISRLSDTELRLRSLTQTLDQQNDLGYTEYRFKLFK